MSTTSAPPAIHFLRHAATTDIGMRRDENQDTYGILECENFRFFIVADGMGGAKGGAVASNMAIAIISDQLTDGTEITIEKVSTAVRLANSEIFQKGNADPSLSGMGTTFVGLAFFEERLLVCNVGDSRAYRMRNGALIQLTTDHTLVQELIRSGSITEDQAERHPISHMLTRSLGPTAQIEVDCRICEQAPLPGDRYLLCSDGLYNMLDEDEMCELLEDHDPDKAVEEMIRRANERGGTDNITAVVIEVTEGYPTVAFARKVKASAVIKEEMRTAPHDAATSAAARQFLNDVLEPRESGLHQLSPKRKAGAKWILGAILAGFAVGGVAGLSLLPGFFDQLLPFTSVNHPTESLPTLLEDNKEAYSLNLQSPKVSLASIPATSIPTVAVVPTAEPTREVLPVVPPPAPDISSILKRKESLEASLVELNQKITAFDKPISGDLIKLRSSLEEKKKALLEEQEKNKQEVELLSRKLAVWFGRRSKLLTNEPVNIANEVAVTVPGVHDAKDRFEQVTWEYLNESEAFRYKPQDKELEARVNDLIERRAQAYQELVAKTRNAIEENVASADKALDELNARKEKISRELHALQREESFIKVLLAPPGEERSHLKDELVKEREVSTSELEGLRSLLNSYQPS